jgi:hypothetical protein
LLTATISADARIRLSQAGSRGARDLVADSN